jgi:recombination protein RecT
MASTPAPVNAAAELQQQLEARAQQFTNALPPGVSRQQFERAALTAVSQNQKLLNVDRRSLINALMRCAQDGLLPDGRQGALVVFRDRVRGEIAQYLPMVAGIRKLVQQSGEITRFEQTVVYERDEFEFRLGDRPEILHRPALNDRGEPILVYSIAQFRDGTLSREVMTREEIEKVRAVSRSKDDGPWTQWWGEMARKTVAKRHAKVLPTSADADDAIARDDDTEFRFPLPQMTGTERRPRLADRLDALSPPGAETDAPRHRRGRQSTQPPDKIADNTPTDTVEQRAQIDLEDAIASDDFLKGVADAKAGRAACLDKDIRDDDARFSDWTQGFNSQPSVLSGG